MGETLGIEVIMLRGEIATIKINFYSSARVSSAFILSAVMERGLRAYLEVLRLVRRLPAEARPYYAKYARENFVNYRELYDPSSLPDLLRRAYNHSLWVLNKVSLCSSYLSFSLLLLLLFFCEKFLPFESQPASFLRMLQKAMGRGISLSQQKLLNVA
ncbi:LYR motif-containing protein [Apostasia shenzhenica]|uniref:LYR motif-containing protein n=1 Tax=Apostasia shenzhenica TaxID=1088818 RepID=A0A2I0ATD6_9ASPA|nr:LYR motif-containing protein [Apostasia shenzhenica]